MIKSILYTFGIGVSLVLFVLLIPPAPPPQFDRVECYLNENRVFLKLGPVNNVEKAGSLFVITNLDGTKTTILNDMSNNTVVAVKMITTEISGILLQVNTM